VRHRVRFYIQETPDGVQEGKRWDDSSVIEHEVNDGPDSFRSLLFTRDYGSIHLKRYLSSCSIWKFSNIDKYSSLNDRRA
jgi:hypothetical protein